MIPGRQHESDGITREILLELKDASLEGTLSLPRDAAGLVLFAHGSGSSRHSPRNRYVAQALHERRIATLLFDLLTRPEEARDLRSGELRFDIDFLAGRLLGATRWVMGEPDAALPKLGYFGASTGAGAALLAAAQLGRSIAAVVSRGGRPDLAGPALASVHAPTLLIVGGNDEPVIEMNREALGKLGSAEKELVIVPGATHLFEEPGMLDEVARLAAEWFSAHFGAANAGGASRAGLGTSR